MFNKQKTYGSPGRLLSTIGVLSTTLIMTCLGYSYKLLSGLGGDAIDPVEICGKVNSVKVPEYSAHCILFVTLILQGWWGTLILNFPFLFYNFAQWYPGKYLLDSTQIFPTLSEVMHELKIKAGLFFLAILYNFWEWTSWSPPSYLAMKKLFRRTKNLGI
mmetsp:Transcript_26008/g.39955  ORF Transcript_26008/g.39955 Transcript_26008/m.39955 type:complete len:160 (+) Transcript_26008:47-526(+)